MGSHTISRGCADRDAGRTAIEALRRVVRALRASSQAALRRTGISGAQLFVIEELSKQRAESLDELAGRMMTHQSSVSVVVARLAAKGLVSRRRSEVDGRRIRLELTRAGRRLHARAPVTAQARLFAAIERLPAATRRSLAAALGALVETMGEAGAGAAPLFFEEPRRHQPRRGSRRAGA